MGLSCWDHNRLESIVIVLMAVVKAIASKFGKAKELGAASKLFAACLLIGAQVSGI